jgi:hypothetical protein
MPELLDFALIRRLREVRERTTPATESELRVLTEQAEAWARTVEGQILSSERRIARIADELRRVETLRPQLREVRSLLADLENRARELRTQWLLTQATSAGATARRPSPRRS